MSILVVEIKNKNKNKTKTKNKKKFIQESNVYARGLARKGNGQLELSDESVYRVS